MKPLPYFACLAVLAGLGCATTSSDRYYTLEYPVTERIQVEDEHPVTLKVKSFDAVDIYRQERIVRRRGENEISYYDTHRWAAPLERMVTDRAVEIFRASLPVERVLPWVEPGAADFLVDGRVLLFEEDLQGDRKVATVGVRIWLDEKPQPKMNPVWDKEVRKACTPNGPEPSHTAIALNQCLQEVLSELSDHLGEEIDRRAKGTAE